jgi:ribosome assembly protein YihI (activator of Der GTPase)
MSEVVMEQHTLEKYRPIEEVQTLIAQECDAVKELLLRKNREYGNSALEPIGIFSGLAAEDQIDVRIDDKLKRIQTIRELDDLQVHEDTEKDLVGYLILKRVARRWQAE